MELFEAIFGRYSQGQVKPDDVPRSLIEQLLSAAVQAPNHYKVRPWRFVVLTGKSREHLGDIMAASFASRHPDVEAGAIEKTKSLTMRSPVLIAVGVDKPTEPQVIELENVCAVSAACQNLLLAAHALGLGAKWRTGEWASDPKVKEYLGFKTDQHIAAFLYIGYPEFVLEKFDRPTFTDRTIWMTD